MLATISIFAPPTRVSTYRFPFVSIMVVMVIVAIVTIKTLDDLRILMVCWKINEDFR